MLLECHSNHTENAMRRNDFHLHAADGIPHLYAASVLPPGHPGWLDQRATGQMCGDLADDPVSSWEHAWIDLGGEG
jgi:hypothetical protein